MSAIYTVSKTIKKMYIITYIGGKINLKVFLIYFVSLKIEFYLLEILFYNNRFLRNNYI